MENRHSLPTSGRSGTARRTSPTLPRCVEENADPAPPSNGTGWNHHSNRHERESAACRILAIEFAGPSCLAPPANTRDMECGLLGASLGRNLRRKAVFSAPESRRQCDSPVYRSGTGKGKLALKALLPRNRHRGESHLSSPATPPDKRVRIRRFGGLS